QCMWKHRGALGTCGWFGCAAVPATWICNVLFQSIAPLIDLQVLIGAAEFAHGWWMQHFRAADWLPDSSSHDFAVTLASFGIFFAVDFLLVFTALRLDRESLRQLRSVFWQRFAYRQLLYVVLLRAIAKAAFGTRMRWGKLERTGSIEMPVQAIRPVEEPIETESAAEPAS
ncbi:MAG TPA: hypothetical protein VEO95_07190, partial [Chthoniobacteraceae bacterium]|nr:hypothetical protein [Chthoniobacteraceae bacterium]